MRILFFSHYFPPEVNAPASRTYENCKRWVRDGHEVTVVTCAPNCPDGVVYKGYTNRLCHRETVDGIQVVRVWTYIAPNEGTVRRIVSYVSYMVSAVLMSLSLRRPDVLIATSPQFFCGWAGVIASRLKRVPFILEIRDIWPEGITAAGGMTTAKRAVQLVERLALSMYRSATHIVTVGGGYKDKLIEKGVSPDRMSIITNGVDQELFSPRSASPDLRRRYGLDSRFVCAYIGTIGMACGLEVVLRAARRLKQRQDSRIVFLLVGDGATRRKLEEEARREGLDNVTFTGRQDKRLMPDFLATSDACLVHLRKTPLYETVLPSKIFEAAAMARPIILGLRGFAADLVRRAGAGLCIEPENEDELLEAVEKLAGSPALREELGRSGRDYVLRHFDREKLATAYLDVIRDVCGPREKGSRPA
jgi:glycosyltransferase involved in cell wall biosynthesis